MRKSAANIRASRPWTCSLVPGSWGTRGHATKPCPAGCVAVPCAEPASAAPSTFSASMATATPPPGLPGAGLPSTSIVTACRPGRSPAVVWTTCCVGAFWSESIQASNSTGAPSSIEMLAMPWRVPRGAMTSRPVPSNASATRAPAVLLRVRVPRWAPWSSTCSQSPSQRTSGERSSCVKDLSSAAVPRSSTRGSTNDVGVSSFESARHTPTKRVPFPVVEPAGSSVAWRA